MVETTKTDAPSGETVRVSSDPSDPSKNTLVPSKTVRRRASVQPAAFAVVTAVCSVVSTSPAMRAMNEVSDDVKTCSTGCTPKKAHSAGMDSAATGGVGAEVWVEQPTVDAVTKRTSAILSD
jgi:hypothetical protein